MSHQLRGRSQSGTALNLINNVLMTVNAALMPLNFDSDPMQVQL